MEAILGQPIRYIQCSRFTALTDELSKLISDPSTKFLVISSLTNIIINLMGASDVKIAIEKAMTSLGASIKDLTRTNAGIRIFVAPCTPRTIESFKDHARHALVSSGGDSSYISYW